VSAHLLLGNGVSEGLVGTVQFGVELIEHFGDGQGGVRCKLLELAAEGGDVLCADVGGGASKFVHCLMEVFGGVGVCGLLNGGQAESAVAGEQVDEPAEQVFPYSQAGAGWRAVQGRWAIDLTAPSVPSLLLRRGVEVWVLGFVALWPIERARSGWSGG
jgi:hypothetical protein